MDSCPWFLRRLADELWVRIQQYLTAKSVNSLRAINRVFCLRASVNGALLRQNKVLTPRNDHAHSSQTEMHTLNVTTHEFAFFYPCNSNSQTQPTVSLVFICVNSGMRCHPRAARHCTGARMPAARGGSSRTSYTPLPGCSKKNTILHTHVAAACFATRLATCHSDTKAYPCANNIHTCFTHISPGSERQ